MKKTICTCLIAAMLLSLFSLPCFAAGGITMQKKGDPTLVYKATYGTPIVDGIKDDLYSDAEGYHMYAAASDKYPDETLPCGEYWIAYNETHLFVYGYIHDETKTNGTQYDTKTDSVDMFLDFTPDFTPGTTHKGVGYGGITDSVSGQVRIDPQLDAKANVKKWLAKKWGSLYKNNQDGISMACGYVKPDSTEYKDGDYYFEYAVAFGEDYAKALATNMAAGKSTYMGFALMINESRNGTSGRYAYPLSNNVGVNSSGKMGTPSGDFSRLGKIELVAPETSTAVTGIDAKGIQMKQEGGMALRVICGVDSIEYEKIGFTLEHNGAKREVTTTTVFRSVQGYTRAKDVVEYTAEELNCRYLATLTVTELPVSGSVTFTITPFTVDREGTQTSGRALTITLTDGVPTACAYSN